MIIVVTVIRFVLVFKISVDWEVALTTTAADSVIPVCSVYVMRRCAGTCLDTHTRAHTRAHDLCTTFIYIGHHFAAASEVDSDACTPTWMADGVRTHTRTQN